ncbi:MAG: insulinase family protein [Candidatus Nomurabacteria bacterium]|nr:MAG: insulinase family protein [Candidatus Nomurabacteria bacterium]HRV75878.1 insulinase family protein [Candidatus Saccharimonadales bacterium]
MEHHVEEVKLKCGAKGLLIDVPGAPVYCMEIWFRGGDAYTESKEKQETAHILEHLAFGANSQQNSSAEVYRFISKNGADLNATTSNNFLSYRIYSPDFDWERLLKQLVVQVTTPKFLEKEFKAEFGNVREEMQLRSNNKWNELGCLMNQRFGWELSDTYMQKLSLMDNVGLEDIKKHYTKVHKSKNAVFFVAGDLGKERSKILTILNGLDVLNKGTKLKLPKEPKIVSYPTNPVVVKKSDVPNIYFSIEMYAEYKKRNRELVETELSILSKVLNGGFHSRIFGKAREMGIIYSMGSTEDTYRSQMYSFDIYAQVSVENMDKLLKLIVSELKDVSLNGLSKEEVEEAVLSCRGSLRMSNQTAGSILAWYRNTYIQGEDERVYNFEDIDKWYDEVTPESIQELFVNLIKTKKWGAGFLGNVTEAQTKKWNKKLAEIFEN